MRSMECRRASRRSADQTPSASPSPPLPRAASAMDQFPDGRHVRLRSRAHGTYLHADADGSGVSLQTDGASPSAAWAVQLLDRGGVYHLLLLHSATHGRYLAATGKQAAIGLRGYRVAQVEFNQLEDYTVRWLPVASGSGYYVLLHHLYRRAYLRANGEFVRWNRTKVTVDAGDKSSQMMHWTVETTPDEETPNLAYRIEQQSQQLLPTVNGLCALLWRAETPKPAACTLRINRPLELLTDAETILTTEGQTSEVGATLSVANLLVEQMPSYQDGDNSFSYIWMVSNSEEANDAIAQWEKDNRPGNAAVALSGNLVYAEMKKLQVSFEKADATVLLKRFEDNVQWTRDYRVLASISQLPCPPKEVATRFGAGRHSNTCALEPWVLVNK